MFLKRLLNVLQIVYEMFSLFFQMFPEMFLSISKTLPCFLNIYIYINKYVYNSACVELLYVLSQLTSQQTHNICITFI